MVPKRNHHYVDPWNGIWSDERIRIDQGGPRVIIQYTHWHKIKPGFDAAVINHLRKEAKVDSLAD